MHKKNIMCNKSLIKALIEVINSTLEDSRWGANGIKCMRFSNLENHSVRSLFAVFLTAALRQKGYNVSQYHLAKALIASVTQKGMGEMVKDTKKVIFDYLKLSEEHTDAFACTAFRERYNVLPEATNELFFSNNSELELQIVDIATKLAAYEELKEMKNLGMVADENYYLRKEEEILNGLSQYDNTFMEWPISEVISLMPMVQELASKLRSMIRWDKQLSGANISVLAHLFQVATVAFVNVLDLEYEDEVAGKCFFMGIIHDLIEARTGDIPSPLKDVKMLSVIKTYFYRYNIMFEAPDFEKITKMDPEEQVNEIEKLIKKTLQTIPPEVLPILKMIQEQKTLRKGAEHAEEYMMEELFKQLPDYMQKVLKELFFEYPGNEEFYFLIKMADYFAAILEALEMYIKGNQSPYYHNATLKTLEGVEEGKYPVGPIVYEAFMEIVDQVDLQLRSCKNDDSFLTLEKRVEQLQESLTKKDGQIEALLKIVAEQSKIIEATLKK